MGNSLKRGADPYADAEGSKVLLAPRIQGHMTASELQGVLPISFRVPIAGRVRRLEVTVRVLTAGAGAIGVDANGATLGSGIVVPTTSAAGVRFAEDFADDAADDNLVAEGDLIEVTTDGVPTAGEINFSVSIEPSP